MVPKPSGRRTECPRIIEDENDNFYNNFRSNNLIFLFKTILDMFHELFYVLKFIPPNENMKEPRMTRRNN